MSEELVFIVMPVFNRERFLRKSVESVIKQRYQNWKLIIVDDNSTDSSPAIIEDLELIDNRISSKINLTHSHSAAGARLSGLERIEGAYVAFLDSDDTWPEYHLSDFVDYLKDNKDVDVVFGDLRRVDPDGNEIISSKFKDENGIPSTIYLAWDSSGYSKVHHDRLLEIALNERFTIGLHSAMYRSHVFENCSLLEIDTGEDFVFTLKIIDSGYNIACSNNIHLNYLVHSGNLSNVNKDMTFSKRKSNFENEKMIYEYHIPKAIKLNKKEEVSRKMALSRIYVWLLGNSLYRESGDRVSALRCILKGIALSPFNSKYWKTLFGTLVK